MEQKDKIKAALLGELIRYMGKNMVTSLADPEPEDEKMEAEDEGSSVEIEVEAPEAEPMDEKGKRLKKLKALAEEC